MSVETKDMLLYGQFQEGLHLQLMRPPAVSGAKNYRELIVVARNEERWLADRSATETRVRSCQFSILILEAETLSVIQLRMPNICIRIWSHGQEVVLL